MSKMALNPFCDETLQIMHMNIFRGGSRNLRKGGAQHTVFFRTAASLVKLAQVIPKKLISGGGGLRHFFLPERHSTSEGGGGGGK